MQKKNFDTTVSALQQKPGRIFHRHTTQLVIRPVNASEPSTNWIDAVADDFWHLRLFVDDLVGYRFYQPVITRNCLIVCKVEISQSLTAAGNLHSLYVITKFIDVIEEA